VTSILDIGSSEEAALFNPAFLLRIVRDAAANYETDAHQNMPVSLAFLVAPLVLHKPTRDDLPRNANSQMQLWIREHPRRMVQLGTHVIGMRPFVGLAIRFGICHGVLTSLDGRIGAGTLKRRPRGLNESESAEVQDCLRAARFTGRWFARQPDVATLLALWGLRP
jgi:hypothetical protein